MRKKIKGVGSATRKLSSDIKQAGAIVNKLDKALNGVVLGSKLGQRLAVGSQVVTAGMDYFGSMMESFGDAGVHPGAGNSLVAGVANGMIVRSTKPRLRNAKGVVRIMHKELVGTVTGTNSTNILVNNGLLVDTTTGQSNFYVNAMNALAFPWLSQIAASYDMYRFKRIRLVYVPLCPTSNSGRVTLAYDQDSSDAVPANKAEISNMECYTEGPVWGVASLDLRLSDTNKWYYGEVLNNTSTPGSYLNQGQFFWATTSGSTGTQGEVYALYDVELKSPQAAVSAYGVAHVTGTTVLNDLTPSCGVALNAPTGVTVGVTFLQPGTYMVQLELKDATAMGTPSLSNVTTVDETWSVQTTPLPNQISRTEILTANTSGATWTLPGNTGLTAYDIIVSRAPARVPPGGWYSI
jgi:hypothetical protein